MSTRWKLNTCKIVAAQGALQGKFPFNRCYPVVQSTDKPGVYGIVNAYWGDFINVTEIEEPTFLEALEEGDWCRVGPVPLVPYADVWMLRDNFPFREDALSDLCGPYKALHGPVEDGSTTWVIIRSDTEADGLLKEWCDDAEVQAVHCCAEGKRDDAYNNAMLSFSLCNAPEKSGVYLAVLEETQRVADHNATLKQLEVTRGPAFTIAVMHCKQKALTDIYKARCDILTKENEVLKRLMPEHGR